MKSLIAIIALSICLYCLSLYRQIDLIPDSYNMQYCPPKLSLKDYRSEREDFLAALESWDIGKMRIEY